MTKGEWQQRMLAWQQQSSAAAKAAGAAERLASHPIT
jgi:hypothetical protein